MGLQNRIIGIELDEEVAENTKCRLKKYENVSIIHGKADENIPERGTIFYLYNPFKGEVLERFMDKLYEINGQRKLIQIIYYNCVHIARIKRDARWTVEEFGFGKRGLHPVAMIRNNQTGTNIL
jgi:protein-L-isoaspartate O-methyltransferase